jgi:hypothetical protein
VQPPRPGSKKLDAAKQSQFRAFFIVTQGRNFMDRIEVAISQQLVHWSMVWREID